MFKELCVINVYNLMSLRLSVHVKVYHHCQGHRHGRHLLKLPPTLFIIAIIIINYCYFCGKRVDHKISPLKN